MKMKFLYPKKAKKNKKLWFLKSMNDSEKIVLYFVEKKDKKNINSFEFIDQKTFQKVDKIDIPFTHSQYTAMTLYKEEFIYAGQENGDIDVWDMKTQKCIKTLRGHKKSISSLSFIEKDKLVSGAKDEGHLYIWDVKNENEKIGRFNSEGIIIQTYKNSKNQLVVTSSNGVFVIDDCVIKNYSIDRKMEWTSSNVIIRKFDTNNYKTLQQLIGATRQNVITKIARNFGTGEQIYEEQK